MSSETLYFKPSVTVDVLALRWGKVCPELLLIQRARAPFKNTWALPGGFIEEDETLEQSARRELQEETGLAVQEMFRFGVYGAPGRDPRGRTITVAYYTVVSFENSAVLGQDDASEADWFQLSEMPELAFDHAKIIQDGLWDLSARFQNQYPLTSSEISSITGHQDWLNALNQHLLVDL